MLKPLVKKIGKISHVMFGTANMTRVLIVVALTVAATALPLFYGAHNNEHVTSDKSAYIYKISASIAVAAQDETQQQGDTAQQQDDTGTGEQQSDPPLQNTFERMVFNALSGFLLTILGFFGNVLILFIQVLIGIFGFGQFVNTPAVDIGWVIIRDLANIGIVVSLMIIAFSMVFNIKKYASSQLLLKLVIAAVLVNFSLLIAGLIIDVGQVVMMTFVNAFENLAAGNLVVGFGLENMVNLAKGDNVAGELTDGGTASLIGAILLAITLLIVASAVILVFVVVLLQRIILLWILIIFSPLAFVAPLLPGGESLIGQWKSKFFSQVTIGPILAFGFWLSMSVLSKVSADQSLVALTLQNSQGNSAKDTALFISKAAAPQAVFDFMVTVGLLLGTLYMAKSAGSVAGNFAGQVQGKLSQWGKRALKTGLKTVGVTGAATMALGGGVATGLVAAPFVRSQMRKTFAGKGVAAATLRGVGKVLGSNYAPGILGAPGRMIHALGSGKVRGISPFAKDRQARADKLRQRTISKWADKLSIDENAAETLSKVPILSKMPIMGTTNVGKVLNKISRDKLNAQKTADIINAGTRDGATPEEQKAAKSEIASLIKSNNHNADGPTPRFKETIGRINASDRFKAYTREVIDNPDFGVKKENVTNTQKAILGTEKSDGTSSVLTIMKEGIDSSAENRRMFRTDEIPESSVHYSQTPKTDEQKMIAEFKKFSELPENVGKSEEKLMRAFAKKQALRERVEPGVSEGVSDEGRSGESATTLASGASIVAPQANITATRLPSDSDVGKMTTEEIGELQRQEVIRHMEAKKAEEPYADDIDKGVKVLKEAKQKDEQELAKTAPASREGVTVGGYGRVDAQGNYQSNHMAVGFDELQKQLTEDYATMGKELPDELKAIGDTDQEGITLHGKNVEPVRNAMTNMLVEQYEKLDGAKSHEEKLNALKLSGRSLRQKDSESQDEFEKRVSRELERTKEQVGDAIVHLSDEDLVKQEGLVLANKNREIHGERKDIRGTLRHEDAHVEMGKLDKDGEIRDRMTEMVNRDEYTELRHRMHEHLKGRKDYTGSADYMDARSVEEYYADMRAGRVKDKGIEHVRKQSRVSDEKAKANEAILSNRLYKRRKDRKEADRLMRELNVAQKSGDAIALAKAVSNLQEFFAKKTSEIGSRKEFGTNPETGKTFTAKELFNQTATGKAIADLAHNLGMGDVGTYKAGRQKLEKEYDEKIAKQDEIISTPPAYMTYKMKTGGLEKAKREKDRLLDERKKALGDYDKQHADESSYVSYLDSVEKTKREYARKRQALEEKRSKVYVSPDGTGATVSGGLSEQQIKKQKAILDAQEKRALAEIDKKAQTKIKRATTQASTIDQARDVVRNINETVTQKTKKRDIRRDASHIEQDSKPMTNRGKGGEVSSAENFDIEESVSRAIEEGFRQLASSDKLMPRNISDLNRHVESSRGGLFDPTASRKMLSGIKGLLDAIYNLDRSSRNNMKVLDSDIRKLKDNIPGSPDKMTDLEVKAMVDDPQMRKSIERIVGAISGNQRGARRRNEY